MMANIVRKYISISNSRSILIKTSEKYFESYVKHKNSYSTEGSVYMFIISNATSLKTAKFFIYSFITNEIFPDSFPFLLLL